MPTEAATEDQVFTYAFGDGYDDWRAVSLTEWKRRLTGYRDEHRAELIRAGLSWGDSKISRLALRLAKSEVRWKDLDLGSVFGIPDPTATKAIRNVELGFDPDETTP